MDLKYRNQRSPSALSNNSDDENNCHFLSDEELEFENGDERIQNDLLNEICTDIGIKDSMDLDFYDMASDSVIQFSDQLPTGIVAGTSETPSSIQDLFNMQNWTPVQVGRDGTSNGSAVRNSTPAGQGRVPFMQPQQFTQRQPNVSKGQRLNVSQGHSVSYGNCQTPQGQVMGQGHNVPQRQTPQGQVMGQGHNVHQRQGQNTSQLIPSMNTPMSRSHSSVHPNSGQFAHQIQMSHVSSSQAETSPLSQVKNRHYQGQGPLMDDRSRQGHIGNATPQGHMNMQRHNMSSHLGSPHLNLGQGSNISKSLTNSNGQSSIVPSGACDEPGAGFFTNSQTQIKKEPFAMNTSHSTHSAKMDASYAKSKQKHGASNQNSALSTPSVRSPVSSFSASPFSFSPNEKGATDIFAQDGQATQFDMSDYCDNILDKFGDSPNETLAATDNLCAEFNHSSTSIASTSNVNSVSNCQIGNNLSNEGKSVDSRRGTFTPISSHDSDVSSLAHSKPPSPSNENDFNSDFHGYETNPNSAMPSRMPSPSNDDDLNADFHGYETNPNSAMQSRMPSPSNDDDLNTDFHGYETNPNSAMPSRMPSPSGFDPSPFVSRWTSPTTAASSPTKDHDDSGSHDLDIKQEPLQGEGQMACGSPSVSSTFPESAASPLPGFQANSPLPGFQAHSPLPGFQAHSPLPGFQGNNQLPGYQGNRRTTSGIHGNRQGSSGDTVQKNPTFKQDPYTQSPRTPGSVRFSESCEKLPPKQLSKVANSDFPCSPKNEPRSPCANFPLSPKAAASPIHNMTDCDTTTGSGSPKPNLQNPINVRSRSYSVFKVPNVPQKEITQDQSRPNSAMESISGNSRASSMSGRPSGTHAGRQVIDLTCDTECSDPREWELKSPHDAGYHSGDLASNASRSTMPTPVPSIHGSTDNIALKSGAPSTSFSQLLHRRLNKVDGYNRYPCMTSSSGTSGGQVYSVNGPTIIPKVRDNVLPNQTPTVSRERIQSENAPSNFRNYPNIQNWNKGMQAPPGVNNEQEQSSQDKSKANYPDDYFRRNSRKTACHFASGNSSVETSPTRHMPRKQKCVNPTFGEYSRDRSPISKARNLLNFDGEENQSQLSPHVDQKAGTPNGTNEGTQTKLTKSGNLAPQVNPESCKIRGIAPLSEFVNRHLPKNTKVSANTTSNSITSSTASFVQQGPQNHSPRILTPKDNTPVVPNMQMPAQNHQNGQFTQNSVVPNMQMPTQTHQNGQFTQNIIAPPSPFNASSLSGVPNESFQDPPLQMSNYGQKGNLQMCSTPQTNGNVRMMQMNKKWQQPQGIGYPERQAPYPQAHGVRQSMNHNMQLKNSEFSQNQMQMQNAQACRYALFDGQTPEQERVNFTPRNTPDFCSNGQIQQQRQFAQNNGMQQYNSQMSDESNGHINGHIDSHFQPQTDFFNDSTPPTDLDYSSPGPPTNVCGDGRIASPNILGPSQAQHWLVQKYKQRAINKQIDNSFAAMPGRAQDPFIKTEASCQYSSQPNLSQFSSGNATQPNMSQFSSENARSFQQNNGQKQLAMNQHMDNCLAPMSGQRQNPFIKTETSCQFTSQPDMPQFSAGNTRSFQQNGRHKQLAPSVAPNVCIDKNSNFIPVRQHHNANGLGQVQNMSAGKFNNLRQPQATGFQFRKDQVSLDDNQFYTNESFGSMVTNISNTTPRPGHQFDGSLLMSAPSDSSQNHMGNSPNPFQDSLGPASEDISIPESFSPQDPNNISDDQLTSIVIGSQEHAHGGQWSQENTQNMPGQINVSQKTNNSSQDARQGFIRNLVCDKSKAFRSHPLFPLLRDLIIADMNFNSPTFPFRLIANLPTDFNKLLHNYLQRNRTNSGQERNEAVEGVIMDALKYAHQSLIEKIAAKKKELGEDVKEQKATSVIEEFCAKFDQAVRNSFQMPDGQSSSQYQGQGTFGRSTDLDMNGDTGSMRGGMSGNQAKKHPVLPKEAVAVMMMWLREHRANPYPNEEEKELLIQQTQISSNQLNYWFTNARRRILPKWAAQEGNVFNHEVTSTS